MEMTYSQIKTLCKESGFSATELDLENDWRILTDSEADEAAKEYILDSVWAFNTSFLMAHVKENITEECLDALKEQYEDGNAAILELLKDVDHFVSDAIMCDGRGHFMSSYDGNEIELGGDLYAYRLN